MKVFLLWVTEINLRSSGLHGKCFYSLSHLAGPIFTVILVNNTRLSINTLKYNLLAKKTKGVQIPLKHDIDLLTQCLISPSLDSGLDLFSSI